MTLYRYYFDEETKKLICEPQDDYSETEEAYICIHRFPEKKSSIGMVCRPDRLSKTWKVVLTERDDSRAAGLIVCAMQERLNEIKGKYLKNRASLEDGISALEDMV